MPLFYHEDPRFYSIDKYMQLPDGELLSFINREHFSPNNDWSSENPVLHCWLANENFEYVRRLMQLIPERINPNLCDGHRFGKKSLLILLTLLPSNATLPFEFINQFHAEINFDYQDSHGRTAAHYAVILGRKDVLSALVQQGASLDIEDEHLLTPLEYLNCPKKCIEETLRTVDIEPSRDINAYYNRLSDHRGIPLTFKGKKLVQTKDQVDKLLANPDLVLIQYIQARIPLWGAFIGDDSLETNEAMFSFASSIAKEASVSIDEVFNPSDLSKNEYQKFRDDLQSISSILTGVSVIDLCLQGHNEILDDLASYKAVSYKPS